MRIISTKLHGIADYILGLAISASPWIFNFSHGGQETWLPLLLGILGISYSLFTRYEYATNKIIPVHVHLILDGISGTVLAASPWLFHFSSAAHLPLLSLGMSEVVIAVLTQRLSRSELNNIAATGS